MDLNYDFFNISNEKRAEAGRVLISEPFLSDNYFHRSVVYLTEYNAKGALGFVLNKSLDVKLDDVMNGFTNFDIPISLGGPVGTDSVHYLHTLGELVPDCIHVKDGVFWGGNFEVIKDLLISNAANRAHVRFFLGYSGWAEKQLDRELTLHAWLVGDIPSALVMKGGNSEFWTDILSNFNPKYKAWANFPEDPGLN